MACGEFSLIARYFDRVRSSRLDVETGIGDDCALLNIPEKQTLAISTDTLVAGTVNDRFELTNEASDLMYHLLVLLQDQDLNLTTVIDNLRKRHQ